MKKTLLLALCLVLTLSALSGCGAAPAKNSAPGTATTAPAQTSEVETPTKKSYKIAYANYNDAIPFTILVKEGVLKAAKEYTDADIEIVVMDNKDDQVQAINNAELAISMDADLLVEFNGQAGTNNTISEKMKAAGIPMLALQIPIEGNPVFVIDNFNTGYLVGEALANYAKENWPDEEIVCFMANIYEAGPAFVARSDGGKAALLEAFPDMYIMEYETKGIAENGYKGMTDFLTAHPDKKILSWMHLDEVAIATQNAVTNAGREDDVIVASVGGTPVIFPELRNPDSKILGSVGLFAENWGYEMIPLMIDMIEGRQVPEVTNPKLEFLTRDNIDQFYPQK